MAENVGLVGGKGALLVWCTGGGGVPLHGAGEGALLLREPTL